MNEALPNLPTPFANITQLKAFFSAKGLNTKDLAALSGNYLDKVFKPPFNFRNLPTLKNNAS